MPCSINLTTRQRSTSASSSAGVVRSLSNARHSSAVVMARKASARLDLGGAVGFGVLLVELFHGRFNVITRYYVSMVV